MKKDLTGCTGKEMWCFTGEGEWQYGRKSGKNKKVLAKMDRVVYTIGVLVRAGQWAIAKW